MKSTNYMEEFELNLDKQIGKVKKLYYVFYEVEGGMIIGGIILPFKMHSEFKNIKGTMITKVKGGKQHGRN